MLLRLRACGGTAPASVPALVRARLAHRASSTDCAAAVSSSSPALEGLAAERKGLTSPFLCGILLNGCGQPSRAPAAPAPRAVSSAAPPLCSLCLILSVSFCGAGYTARPGMYDGTANAVAMVMVSCLLKCCAWLAMLHCRQVVCEVLYSSCRIALGLCVVRWLIVGSE
jgi:hypothetical protein